MLTITWQPDLAKISVIKIKLQIQETFIILVCATLFLPSLTFTPINDVYDKTGNFGQSQTLLPWDKRESNESRCFSNCSSLRHRRSETNWSHSKRDIKIGAIFSHLEDDESFLAFQAALELINAQSDKLLPRGVRLIYERLLTSPTGLTELTSSRSGRNRLNSTNSFHLSKLLCRRLESSGYHLILGPSHSTLSSYVQSICDAMDVPHILTHPELTGSFGNIPRINLNGDYRDNTEHHFYEDEYSSDQWSGSDTNHGGASSTRPQSHFSINVAPRTEDVNLAYRDFLIYANFSRVAILYSDRDEKSQNGTDMLDGDMLVLKGAIHLQDLLLREDIDVHLRRLRLKAVSESREIIQEVKRKDLTDIVMYAMTSSELPEFFKLCHEIGLSGDTIHFFLASLDVDMEKAEAKAEKYVHSNQAPSMKPGEQDQSLPNYPSQRMLRDSDKEWAYFNGQNETLTNGTSRHWSPFDGDEEFSGLYRHNSAIFYAEPHLKSFFYYRMINQQQPTVRQLSKKINSLRNKEKARLKLTGVPAKKDSRKNPDFLSMEAALMYDSLLVVAEAVKSLNFASFVSGHTNVSCDNEKAWELGATFFNYLNSVSIEGITGKIRFQGGRRSSLELDLNRYLARADSVKQIGQWSRFRLSQNHGIRLKNIKQESLNSSEPLVIGGLSVPNITAIKTENETDFVTLVVVTKEERPYVMLNKGRTGNDAYDGFSIDLLKAISDVIGFRFRLYTVPDNLYGVINPETGEWNGIVRQLIDKRADLAVASMTINYARESVIDFTKPFMNLGISILFKAPKDPATELFSFMNPLALEIWLYILLAYILVSITIWIVARFSPYEWARPNPCYDTGLVFQNDFTLPNSFWFAIGTLMQQGSDLNPRAASTRIVGGIWWFFILIILSSYTANLAAFLTVERMATPIESADDLADQSEIRYGTLVGGSTMTFFRDSKMERYQKMWRYMESNTPHTFVYSYEEGVERVLNGSYAFLGESTMLDYLVQRNCNLTQIGGLLDSKGYGIATPKGSRWRDPISQAILFLQEKGVIQMYYDKWWKNHNHNLDDEERVSLAGCPRKSQTLDQKAMANALGVVNIGGIFVVLLCGLAFAVLVAICEFCWKTSKREDALFKNGSTGESLSGSNRTRTLKSNIRQTSPDRWNRRRKSSGGRWRNRTTLCKELAKTFMPYAFYDNDVMNKGEKDKVCSSHTLKSTAEQDEYFSASVPPPPPPPTSTPGRLLYRDICLKDSGHGDFCLKDAHHFTGNGRDFDEES